MKNQLSSWMLLVMVVAMVSISEAQTSIKTIGGAPAVLPSGLGEGVDRDIMTVRDATARFKSTKAAEAAGYKQVTGCVEH